MVRQNRDKTVECPTCFEQVSLLWVNTVSDAMPPLCRRCFVVRTKASSIVRSQYKPYFLPVFIRPAPSRWQLSPTKQHTFEMLHNFIEKHLTNLEVMQKHQKTLLSLVSQLEELIPEDKEYLDPDEYRKEFHEHIRQTHKILKKEYFQSLRGTGKSRQDKFSRSGGLPTKTVKDKRLLSWDYAELISFTVYCDNCVKEVEAVCEQRLVVARLARQIEDLRPTEVPQITDFLASAFQVSWKILPPGLHAFNQILQYFESIQHVNPTIKYEPERLRKVHELNPDKIYVGLDAFQGYVVFVFQKSQKAVLECPLYGNAIYMFEGNWEVLSRLSKNELLVHHSDEVVKITHVGDWFDKLKKHLSLA